MEFKKEDGQKYVEEFSCEANKGIVMFPCISPAFPLPHQFPLASYRGSFEETMLDQKTSIETIVQKLGLAETHPYEVLNWERFWESQPKGLMKYRTLKHTKYRLFKTLQACALLRDPSRQSKLMTATERCSKFSMKVKAHLIELQHAIQ